MLAPLILAAAFGPFATPAAPVTRDARDESSRAAPQPSSDPFAFPFRVYQLTLSSQDGPRCSHAPTCSLYGLQAVRRHPLLGFGLTADRLWRDGRSSALRSLPLHFDGRTWRHFDPVEADDFWLRGLDALSVGELRSPVPRQGR